MKSEIASKNRQLAADFLDVLSDVVRQPAALHEPTFAGNEWKYTQECLDTGWVSSLGKFVDRFERDLAEFTGCKHAVAVANGTCALHVSLLLAGVRDGDEVLVPALTFIATANAVRYCGANPHFIDSEEATLGVNPDSLRRHLTAIADIRGGQCINRTTGARIAAIVPMHTFGHPVRMDSLLAVCEEFKIPVVEDAAESLGSYYKGVHTGNAGIVSALSFNGNKIVTTGGGGAVLTNDPSLGKRAKHLTTTAKVPHKWAFFHDDVGFNYRLPNLNAALGCAQLEQLPLFLGAKRRIADRYAKAFSGMGGLRFVSEPANTTSNYWLCCVLLDGGSEQQRDDLLEAAHSAGFYCRPAWTLMHKLPMFKDCPRMALECALAIEERLISLPSSPKLGFDPRV